MDNRNKIDQLHDLMPAHFNTRTNTNWKALIEAIGTSDQAVVDLITEVKKQFFIKTSYRPYLDNLGANAGISRPAGVGMDDTTFKKYIPILAYTPKQVKLIIDQLLNIFFAKETTTAYVISGQAQPFLLQDGWELEYKVDGIYDELIHFNQADFTNINAATAQEITAAINRQAQHSFAENYYDNISKGYYVKIFSNTIGSKGSIQIEGGRANIPLQFNGFIANAGNGSNTTWTVSKVGDQVTFQYVGGANPNLNLIQVGDIIISLIPGNVGSFTINSINLGAGTITFTNLFGTPGTYTQTDATQTKFFTPNKYVVYTQNNRAVTWEVTPGEVIVEIPATPPVVKRTLNGAAHINGSESVMSSYNSATSITVADASQFPMAGSFWLQEVDEIQTRYFTPSENTVASTTFNGRLQGTPTKYTYTSRLVLATTGDTTAGSTQITNVASVVGLVKGQNVFMVGVPSYALITNVIGSTVFIDFPATATATSVPVQFAGATLTGITPDLPTLAVLDEQSLTSLTRASGIVTATTSSPHDFKVGQTVNIYGSSGIAVETSTADVQNGLNLLTNVTPVGAISQGIQISGNFVPQQTYIQNVSGTTVEMTQNATGTAIGETVVFSENLNGSFVITSVTSNTFTYEALGTDGTATTPGTARVDNIGLASSGSLVIITNALPSSFTRLTGSYVWDLSAPFVLSENTAKTIDAIQAGQVQPLLNLSQNTIPAAGGYVVFDYGLETQEGPIRYLYAPNDTALVLDPSYVFQFNHGVGSSVVSIDNKGPHLMSGLGTEFPPYITNPSDVRVTLEKLIQSVASSGIFIDFLVRYPEQLYGTIAVYQITG
jgi:hypothetical protein